MKNLSEGSDYLKDLPDPKNWEEDLIESIFSRQLSGQVQEFINKVGLTEREKQVIHEYYTLDKSHAEIASNMPSKIQNGSNVTGSRVGNMKEEAIKKMRKYLGLNPQEAKRLIKLYLK